MVFSRGARRRGCEEGPRTCVAQPRAGLHPAPAPGRHPDSGAAGAARPWILTPRLLPAPRCSVRLPCDLRSEALPSGPPQSSAPRTAAPVRSSEDERHSTARTPGHPPPFGDWLLERDKSRRPSHYEFLKSAFQFLSRSGFAHEMTECKFKMTARLAKCRLLTRDTLSKMQEIRQRNRFPFTFYNRETVIKGTIFHL